MPAEPFRPRMRLIPLLLCCMSGSGFAAGLPPLGVSPDLLQGGGGAVRPVQPAVPASAPAADEAAPAAVSTAVSESTVEPVPAAQAATSSTAAAGAAPAAPVPPRSKASAAPAVPVVQDKTQYPAGTTVLDADRLSGVQGENVHAEGNAVLVRDDLRLRGDQIDYAQVEDVANARGNVVLVKGDTTISGPSAWMEVGAQVGEFLSPDYTMSRIARSDEASREGGWKKQRVTGSGSADVLKLEGENQYHLKNATWSTCGAQDPDWYFRARDLRLDYDRDVGEARDSTLVFKNVPLLYSPWVDFPLADQRQSGFLAPTIGTANTTGFDYAQPYYWNIAPNYDATFTPRWMGRRGVQLGTEFRYLTPEYSGRTQVEWLPRDEVTGGERAMGSIQHTQTFAPGLVGSLNLNGVSDTEYFKDLSSRLQLTSKSNLVREGRLSYSSGSWWQTSALVQSYQTLDGPDLYRRMPQLLFTGQQPYLPGGLAFDVRGEYVNFTHPDSSYVEGRRLDLKPSIALPMEGQAYFVRPKLTYEYTSYSLDRSNGYTGSTSLNRSLPLVSVDSGLVFERDTTFRGAAAVQTLEPRLYYLYVPYRNQDDYPVFDTALYDFNFSQLFSDNLFIGADRVANANQMTAALTSRIISADNGAELMKVAFGQRYYFEDQKVALPGGTLRTGKRTDYLAGFTGKVTRNTDVDATWQYNPDVDKTQRFNFGFQFKPDFAKVLNVNYRYTRETLRDIDVAGQWPLFGNWYGVARYTRSLFDHRITEALAGLEYAAGCWVFRTAFHRFATTEQDTTQALFFQLELGGLTSIGSSPVSLLKRSVQGYGMIDQNPASPVFGTGDE